MSDDNIPPIEHESARSSVRQEVENRLVDAIDVWPQRTKSLLSAGRGDFRLYRATSHPRNQEIGFVFQQFNLIQKLTAFSALSYDLSGYQLQQTARNGMDAIERVNDGTAASPEEQLSGGQQQRRDRPGTSPVAS